jgi:hypothetical protein
MNRLGLLASFILVGSACGVSQTGGTTPTGGTTGSAGVNGAAGQTASGGTPGGTGGSPSTGGTGGTPTTGNGGSAAGGSTVGAGGTGGTPSTGGAPGTGGATPDGGTDTATLPPSGMTVNIGGTMVPSEKVVLFIHIGHSNMAGRATDPVALHDFNYTTSPRLWSYAKGGVWKAAVEPLSPDNVTMGKAGPGMSILRAALAVAPPDLYFVSVGHGQSGMTGGYCRGYLKGGLFYSSTMDAALELKAKGVTFGAIWFMMGTAEFADTGHVSTFGQCLTSVVTSMRTDLGMPKLPVLLGDWEMGAMGKFLPTTDFAKSVIAQIKTTAAAVQPAAIIPTDGLAIQDPDPAANGEGVHHYNYAGHKGWGERGVALLKTGGWAPWALP